jgi:PAS domain S-box-containing protein
VATEPFALHEAVLDAQARMGQGILIVDVPTGKIVYANGAVAEMSGYSVEQILELPSFMALSPPTHASTMEASRVRRLQGSDEPNEWDTVIHRKDGTALDIEVAVSPVDGEPNLMVALLRDVTGRKATERALRNSENRLRTLVTRSPVLLWTVGTDGVFTAIEGQSMGDLRITSEDMIGRSIDDVYSDMPEVRPYYERALAG